MAKNSKTDLHAQQPDDETTDALDFDASHDEDQRQSDGAQGSGRASSVDMPQRAPNQRDAPGAEVRADDLDDEQGFDDDGQPTGREAELDGVGAMPPGLQRSEAQSDDDLDEAELADVDPVGRRESRALQQKIARHARDPNSFEPAEAEMQRQLQAERSGRKP